MSVLSHVRCPVCRGALIPTELHCVGCDLSMKGHFAANEFSTLGEDELHFLRIFVLCEGRIRDMESAMGVSYPTIKARMAQLKAALAPRAPVEVPPTSSAPPASKETPANDPAAVRVLKDLEAGVITYEQALEKLKQK